MAVLGFWFAPTWIGTQARGEIERRAAVPAGDRVLVYRKARIRSFIVAATDARDGWPAPELIPTPGEYVEPRRAAPRRRRLWL